MMNYWYSNIFFHKLDLHIWMIKSNSAYCVFVQWSTFYACCCPFLLTTSILPHNHHNLKNCWSFFSCCRKERDCIAVWWKSKSDFDKDWRKMNYLWDLEEIRRKGWYLEKIRREFLKIREFFRERNRKLLDLRPKCYLMKSSYKHSYHYK